jgi:hypothetical protein
MTIYRDYVAKLIKRTLVDPRGAAKQIIELNIPKPALWNAVFLVVIMSVLLTYGTLIIAGQETGILELAGSPIIFVFYMVAQLVLLVFAMFWVGKALGGTGALDEILVLIVWLQTLWLLAQIVQTVVLVFAPNASTFIGFASIIYGIWIMINFISESHGFPSWVKGALTLMLALIGVIIGIAIILSVIGVSSIGLSSYV